MTDWSNRIVGEGEEVPDQLLAHPENWRIHPEEQQAAMEGALATVGWVQRVVVNRTTGHIVDGHLRVMLAMRHNESSLPVLYVELSEAEERLILASLDSIGAMAVRDDEKLGELLDSIDDVEHEGLQSMLDTLIAEEGGTGSGGGGESGDNYKEQYGVIIICNDEAHQQRIYEAMDAEGYNCKVVVT